MRTLKLLSLLCLCAQGLPLRADAPAGAFTLSHAPVVNDPTLTHRDTAKMWPHVSQEGVVFLDGRTPEEYAQERIPGAVLLTPADFDNSFPLVKSKLVHAKVLLCYCHGYSCGIADYLAQLLAEKGFRTMAVFSGGFPAWKRAHYPTEGSASKSKSEHHSLPLQ
jgi:rhodanese-related sulfurtransferase